MSLLSTTNVLAFGDDKLVTVASRKGNDNDVDGVVEALVRVTPIIVSFRASPAMIPTSTESGWRKLSSDMFRLAGVVKVVVVVGDGDLLDMIDNNNRNNIIKIIYLTKSNDDEKN
jgi:hypothetical protein